MSESYEGRPAANVTAISLEGAAVSIPSVDRPDESRPIRSLLALFAAHPEIEIDLNVNRAQFNYGEIEL